RVCSAPTVFPNANFADKPWANDYLRISDAQRFATGAGVTVAVIDTGVNGSPRVPAEPGGDFVDKAGNGMSDCDSHGTLTASIIASGLGAAINYAVNVKGAVIVVAAGNTGQDCSQNPPPDAGMPADPRGWKQVQTIVSPAWYSPMVLTVGGIAQNGQPSNFSMN